MLLSDRRHVAVGAKFDLPQRALDRFRHLDFLRYLRREEADAADVGPVLAAGAKRRSALSMRVHLWSRSWRMISSDGTEMRPRVCSRKAAARSQNPERPAHRASSNMMRCSASALRPCAAALALQRFDNVLGYVSQELRHKNSRRRNRDIIG